MTDLLLPDLPGFSLQQITIVQGVITVLAHSQPTSGHCPECGHLASRIHSRDLRTLADLPWGEHAVRLVVRVHRFFSTLASGVRNTFVEALPVLAERFACWTTQLQRVLAQPQTVSYGEQLKRLADLLGESFQLRTFSGSRTNE